MIQHSSDDGCVAFSGTCLQQHFGSFRAGGSCGQNVIHDQDALILDDVCIAYKAGLFLIIKPLSDGNTFLGAGTTFFLQDVDVAGNLQHGGQFFSDQPCRVEMSKQSLSPVLWNRDDTINLQQSQLRFALECQQSCEGLNLH